jgi:hypothetical protein
VIQGSDNADGVYPGTVGSPAVMVTGAQWLISVEHNPTGPADWNPSAERLTWPTLAAGEIRFDIRSNDSGSDQDYNDLILTCTTAANDAEFVLYGKVRSYSGLCRFNPCFFYPWVVIDTASTLKELLKYASVRAVLEKL